MESVWTGEHYVLPEPRIPTSPASGRTPMLDPFVCLAHLAGRTSTLLLGTGLTVVPLHQPLALAKRVESLDRVSGGRFLLGVGVGYLEPEFAAIGAPFDHRGPRTDEYLDAMVAIWTEESPSFDGRFMSFAGMRAEPRPPRVPPLHVGGHVDASFRRAVRRGHGWYGYALDPAATEHCLTGLRRAENEVERAAGLPPLEVSVTPPPTVTIDRASVDAYAALGVTRMIITPPRDVDVVRFIEELPAQLV